MSLDTNTANKLLNETLDLVNEIRDEAGWLPLNELPKGIPNNSDCCVIARALNVSVGTLSMQAQDKDIQKILERKFGLAYIDGHYAIPNTFADFIFCFDEHDFPELVEGRKYDD
jgi:hypothetical protein